MRESKVDMVSSSARRIKGGAFCGASSKISPPCSPSLDFLVVGIGVASESSQALKAFFNTVPDKTGMAFVVVWHSDGDRDCDLTPIVSQSARMKTVLVSKKEVVKPDHVYVVAPNSYLTLKNGVLTPVTRSGASNIDIDLFFLSLAEEQKEKAVGIILSGTGADGSRGSRFIKYYNGVAMVQILKSTDRTSMTRNIMDAGGADYVLPIEEIPDALSLYAKKIREEEDRGRLSGQLDERGFDRVLTTICSQLNYNFGCYKRSTLLRRLRRRMILQHKNSLSEYADFLNVTPGETKKLVDDFLIGVTSFFRESETWSELDELVLSKLVSDWEGGEPVRIWVPGCSTGEEAYTIAMLMREHNASMGKTVEFQIFATDIDDTALETARVGKYPQSIAKDISPERLGTHFIQDGDGYRVCGELRDCVVFSSQNLIADPPFSKLDLISCRNVLIYLNPDIQKKILRLFHFALRNKGVLVLGSSETVGQQFDLFDTVSKSGRIFRRIGAERNKIDFPIRGDGVKAVLASRTGEVGKMSRPADLANLTQAILVRRYAPAAVLINKKQEVLYLSGDTSPFLLQSEGMFSSNLLSMARKGLVTRLRSAVQNAIQTQNPVEGVGARVKRDGEYHAVTISVVPLDKEKEQRVSGLYLVTFSDAADSNKVEHLGNLVELSEEDEHIVEHLERELKLTKDELQRTIEEMEVSSEELKSSNEEIMSMNEELQASNEELETSKEELQSLNEELNTVNAQLHENVMELEQTNNDLMNMMTSTQVATLFLDSEQRIRLFTPVAQRVFSLIDSDIGRDFRDISLRIADEGLYGDIENVLKNSVSLSKEVRGDDGRWFVRHVFPYRKIDKKSGGVVIVLSDITQIKRQHEALEKSERQKTKILDGLLESVVLVRPDFSIKWANQAAWGGCADHVKIEGDRKCYKFLKKVDTRCAECPVPMAIRSGKPETSEVKVHKRVYQVQANPLFDDDGKIMDVLCASLDITLLKNSQAELEDQVKAKTRDLKRLNDDLLEAKEEVEKSALRYRQLFDSTPLGLAVHELILDDQDKPIDYKFLNVNQSFEKLTGMKAEDILGRTIMNVMPKTEKLWVEKYGRVVLTGEPIQFNEFSTELDKYYEVSAFRNAPGQFTTAFSDVTERKKAEEELLKMRNLESIGTLAGGIAHDFNNILAGLFGNLSLSKMKLDQEHPAYRYLDKAEQAMERAKKLTGQLLTFSRGGAPIKENVDLSSLVQDIVRFDLSGSNVKPVFDINDNLPEVAVDKKQMQQVVAHLVMNAREAMPKGGTLSVHMRKTTFPPKNDAHIAAGDYIKLIFKDEGVGIAPRNMSRIFNPYFTTKELGSGLGLTTVHSIVSKHHGYVDVDSTLGVGTTFSLLLPVSRDYSTKPVRRRPITEPENRRILLMDDEEIIRDMAFDILDSEGFSVELACDSTEAIDLYRKAYQAGTPYDVVILDLTIPGGPGGKEVAEEILSMDRNARLVVSSGYANDPVMGDYEQFGFKGGVVKPYRPNDLMDELNRILS